MINPANGINIEQVASVDLSEKQGKNCANTFQTAKVSKIAPKIINKSLTIARTLL